MVWWFFDVSAVCNIFSLKNLIHAISGGVGSAFAITTVYPFETARTQLQVELYHKSTYSFQVIKDVYKQDGLGGLYRGWWSLIVSQFLTHFVYFYMFHGLKAVLCHENLEQLVTTDLIFGILAGFVAVLVTNPLWVVNTKLKLQQARFKDDKPKTTFYTGIIDGLKTIVRQEGVLALWSGTVSSILLVSNPSIQFMIYELLKRNLQLLFDSEYLGDTCYFTCGASAKVVATLSTYPLQVIQTRLRAGYSHSADGRKTTLVGIMREQGITGLYRGLEAKLLQTVLTAALMFMLYERISTFILNIFSVAL